MDDLISFYSRRNIWHQISTTASSVHTQCSLHNHINKNPNHSNTHTCISLFVSLFAHYSALVCNRGACVCVCVCTRVCRTQSPFVPLVRFGVERARAFFTVLDSNTNPQANSPKLNAISCAPPILTTLLINTKKKKTTNDGWLPACHCCHLLLLPLVFAFWHYCCRRCCCFVGVLITVVPRLRCRSRLALKLPLPLFCVFL